jgi:hypothetical protein
MAMIHDPGCDPYKEMWAEQATQARHRARMRRRQLITNAVGYALVLGGMAWVCLRWLS